MGNMEDSIDPMSQKVCWRKQNRQGPVTILIDKYLNENAWRVLCCFYWEAKGWHMLSLEPEIAHSLIEILDVASDAKSTNCFIAGEMRW